jgi:hypothetical protein
MEPWYRRPFFSVCQNLVCLIGSVWLTANILSQVMFYIDNGRIYDGIEMLEALGRWYWVVLVLEVLAWLFLGRFLLRKTMAKVRGTADASQAISGP